MQHDLTESPLWWKHGVIYHIYPRSFYDSNDDGIGDIKGITQKLDYLLSLGVTGIWLSPVYLSPMVDFGYDVADYRRIDPSYGTLDDFKEMLLLAHEKGIKVIMDMILNHTSDQHPWFLESRSSKDNPKRNWYIWRDGQNRKAPNNWQSAAGGSAWAFDETSNQYYCHSFFTSQPDLNWRKQELRDAFFEELRFWLDLGVDGFRLDVINFIIKDKKFRDNPYFFGFKLFQNHIYTRNRRKSYEIVRQLRQLVEPYKNRVLVGEVYTLPPGDSQMAASYLAEGEGIHMAFDFSLIFRNWNARTYAHCIMNWYAQIPENGWPCHVLSNHDLFRSIDRFPWRRHKEEKARVAAVLLLTLKGTPFIYYGEEIGMRNGKIKRKEIRDPYGKRYWPFFTGRDKSRTPMQWNEGNHGGFSNTKPWLPVNLDFANRNVEQQLQDKSSLLQFYQEVIALRNRHSVLQEGRWVPLITGLNGILAYARVWEEERFVIVLNFTGRKKIIELPEHSYGTVVYSTHRIPSNIFYFQELWIHPFEASIFKAALKDL